MIMVKVMQIDSLKMDSFFWLLFIYSTIFMQSYISSLKGRAMTRDKRLTVC